VTQPERNSRRWLQLVIGIAISALMIWWAFRDTPFRDVWQLILAQRPLPMAVAVILATLPFALRVPRWQLLLRREDGSRIGGAPMWHAIAIGFAANNTLPARLGEVFRVGAVSRLAPVSFTSALSSLVVERVLDALAVVGLLSIALVLVDLPDAIQVRGMAIEVWATRIGILGAVALAFGVVIASRPTLATSLATALTPRGRIREVATSLTARVVDGLTALRDPRRAIPIVAWTLVIWLVNASAFYVGFAAFGIEVPFAAALILQGLLVFAIAVPQGPGFVGVFEAVIAGALALFGVEADVALAYAISYHVLTFVPITVMGAWSLVSTGLSLRGAREAAS
jgi:uncharacterized protein (TIRG00374 family)